MSSKLSAIEHGKFEKFFLIRKKSEKGQVKYLMEISYNLTSPSWKMF